MRSLLPALFLAIIGTVLVLILALAPTAGEGVLIVYAAQVEPKAGFTRLVALGWLPIRLIAPHIILAYPSDAARSLLGSGAVLVLSAQGARGCY